MDVLKAEIAKKRKLLEEKKLVVSTMCLLCCGNSHIEPFVFGRILQDDKKKFFKRGDLLSQEKEEYLKKMSKQNQATLAPENSSSTGE